MTYPELKNTFRELNRNSPGEDLTAHIVFTEDSFDRPYGLINRTYQISSDNKAFRPNSLGYSIFAWCLDPNSDQGIRLEQYMAEERNPGGWKVRECYVLEHMPDAAAIPGAVREEQEGGTACWSFGDTRIRAREVRNAHGWIDLEPVSGDRAAGGARTELPMDRVYGYCTLLERLVNA